MFVVVLFAFRVFWLQIAFELFALFHHNMFSYIRGKTSCFSRHNVRESNCLSVNFSCLSISAPSIKGFF